MRAALILAPGLFAACLGHDPNPDEEAAPVATAACQSLRCGADTAALIGTWKLERGCAMRSNPLAGQCPDSMFFPSIAAAGTISFTADVMTVDIHTYSDNVVIAQQDCLFASCEELDGFLGEGSRCVDTGEGACRCTYVSNGDIDFAVTYTVDGDQLRTSFGEDYDLCLRDGTLSLTHFTPGEADLENYTLVRGD